MNYVKHAAIAERVIGELGDPPVVAVTLWDTYVTVQIDDPIEGYEWQHRVSEYGDHWRVELERNGVRIELVAFKAKAVAA